MGDCNTFIWHFVNDHCRMEQIAKLTFHTECVNVVSWSSDGSQLATAGQDKLIAVWKQDTKYDPCSEENAQPAFGEETVFKEKWLPYVKIRGPLAEICGMQWLQDDKCLIVSTLDGSIEFYSVKKQQK